MTSDIVRSNRTALNTRRSDLAEDFVDARPSSGHHTNTSPMCANTTGITSAMNDHEHAA
ncbi:hypothetical protein [Lysobacter terrae]